MKTLIRPLRSNKQKGFTLLELLVVISIIAILIAIGVASFTTAQQKGRNAKRRADMKAMQNAQEQYYAQSSSVYSTTGTCGSTNLTTYLNPWPTDPKGAPYTYSCNTLTAATYCYCAQLENETGNSTDANCTFGSSGSYFCVRQLQ